MIEWIEIREGCTVMRSRS